MRRERWRRGRPTVFAHGMLTLRLPGRCSPTGSGPTGRIVTIDVETRNARDVVVARGTTTALLAD